MGKPGNGVEAQESGDQHAAGTKQGAASTGQSGTMMVLGRLSPGDTERPETRPPARAGQ